MGDEYTVIVNEKGIVINGPDSRMAGAKLVGTVPAGSEPLGTVTKLSAEACVWVKLVTGWK